MAEVLYDRISDKNRKVKKTKTEKENWQ